MGPNDAVMLNSDDLGFYRVLYDARSRELIEEHYGVGLLANADKIKILEKLQCRFWVIPLGHVLPPPSVVC